MSSKKKRIIALTVIAILGAGGVWAARYAALFDKDELADGPVVVNQEAAQRNMEATAPVPYAVERVTTGLVVPWSIVFPDEDRWLVSERAGSVRVVEGGVLQPEPLVSFSDVSSTAEEGLMGLALDPSYMTNRLVYACYARPSGNALVDRVVRFEDNGSSVSTIETVIDDIPAARFHAGCRLGFGPDDKLYITTGDATDKNIAQDQQSLGGKILRINSDGSIPDDNPFPGSPVWSSGHRNPQGIAWQPGTDQLFSTEHGPSLFDGPAGGDEVNIIQRGENYGWPVVSHEETDERFVSPLLVFTPAAAPGGAAFYSSDALPQFTGDFFFAALKGEGLVRVVLDDDDPSSVVLFEKLDDVNVGRVRDVVEGPDGALYFLTSNRDGRGDPRDGDDAVYRIGPE